MNTYQAIADPSAGEGVSTSDYGLKVINNIERFHDLEDAPMYIPLNGATALVTGDKQYYRVPAKYNGGTLVAVAANCKVASTAGNVELTVKNGSTSMLSVNILLDQGETDTLTSSQPGTINTSADDVATGDMIEVSVVSAGESVTYCGVELTFRPAA